MATATWNSEIAESADTGNLGTATNYVSSTKAAGSDNLVFNTLGDRSVTAGLDEYNATDLGKVVNNGFVGDIGFSDEWLEVLSATKIKHDGFGKCYYQGDCPLIIVYDTHGGEVHLRNDSGATPAQDFDVVHAIKGTVHIDDFPTNHTDLDTLHVYPGAEVTIAEGVVRAGTKAIVFHGGGIVHDKAGGDILIQGEGGTYYLEDDAALTHSGALDIHCTFVHKSSGSCANLNLRGKARLVTKDNTRGGTAGTVTRFPGATHDLDTPESGVTASSIVEAVETIAA